MRITNTDLVLLRKMKIALLRFGIFSYISHQVKTKHKGKKPVDVYNLTIADKESLLSFKKFIKPYKFINWRKLLSKDFKYNRREGKVYTLSKVMKLEEIYRNSDIYDFESPSNKYILNGFIVHNSHPSISERKYKLIWEDKPASLICWEHFKDKIPKKEWWKVVIGASGDGQVEKVPYEVFETSPELFKVSIWKSKSWSSKWSISAYPAYKLLSSPINAFARFGQFNEVLSIIEKAKSPLDILHSPEIFRKKDELKRVFEDVMSKADVYDFGNLKIIIFSSPKVRLSGYIASVLGNDVGTVMAINSSTGSLSLRGDLALYYREKLKPLDYIEIDGHPGFMGGKIHTKPQKLIDDLFNLL